MGDFDWYGADSLFESVISLRSVIFTFSSQIIAPFLLRKPAPGYDFFMILALVDGS